MTLINLALAPENSLLAPILILLIPAFAAVLSYAVVFVLGLVKILCGLIHSRVIAVIVSYKNYIAFTPTLKRNAVMLVCQYGAPGL